MARIYVSGHQNPDVDSLASAYCYSWYRNTMDSDNTYLPIRCGNLTSGSRFLFTMAGLEPPDLRYSIAPRVGDVVSKHSIKISIHTPLFDALQKMRKHTLSVLPVYGRGDTFYGPVSMDDVTEFLVQENLNARPIYHFRPANFKKVMHGVMVQKGERSSFSAPLVTGTKQSDAVVEKALIVTWPSQQAVNYAIQSKAPALVFTGVRGGKLNPNIDIKDYRGHLFLSELDTAETIRMLRLSISIMHAMPETFESVEYDLSFDAAKKRLLESRLRGLPVFRDGEFYGIVTRRCFIEKPTSQLIMVDHNEVSQSVGGADEACICEIIDHHRFAANHTKRPIYISAAPVGSTCTLVFQHIQQSGLSIPRSVAMLLLGGILSDTVILESPTATKIDKEAVRFLEERIGIPYAQFGKDLFSHTAALKSMDPVVAVESDFKIYHQGSISFGIGQVEVVTFRDVKERKELLLQALQEKRIEKGLNWSLLLITHVVKKQSILLCCGWPEGEELLFYEQLAPCEYHLPGVLSRKKQLLPEILRVVESFLESQTTG